MMNPIHLETLIDDYISYKHTIGYAYKTEAYYLKQFASFCAHEGSKGIPSTATVQTWIRKREQETPTTQHTRISPIRVFLKYLSEMGYEGVYQVPRKVCPTQQRTLPHFLTEEEIEAFFRECDKIQNIQGQSVRHLILPVIFRLIYCCGLRPKEARTILVHNVNLSEGYIDILQSKGYKDRRLFLTDELIEMLAEYDAAVSAAMPERLYFFPKDKISYYGKCFISKNFNRIWRRALPMATAKVRAYDFRHHFAFANVNKWIEEGKDVNVMLPYLMRYMGHTTILSTYYYVHFTPQFFGTYLSHVGATEAVLPEVGYEN